MDVPHEIIEILFEGGWKIIFRGYSFGPYAHGREAIETAEMWAENGRRQGLAVIIKAETASAPSAVMATVTGRGGRAQ
jgi:hypothetical protein